MNESIAFLALSPKASESTKSSASTAVSAAMCCFFRNKHKVDKTIKLK